RTLAPGPVSDKVVRPKHGAHGHAHVHASTHGRAQKPPFPRFESRREVSVNALTPARAPRSESHPGHGTRDAPTARDPC
ncbi:MAG TPA: hypothetical protein VIM73_21935, partial [Polyangiaceae bacterium]